MLEEIVPLDPISFFAFQMDCHAVINGKLEKSHLLPALAALSGSYSFAELFLGWDKNGLYCKAKIEGAFEQPNLSNLLSSDSIELFFDTRDIKTSGFTTRFCHHFFFLPVAVEHQGEWLQAAEITRFRTEDRHELCDPSLLQVETIQNRKETLVNIFIPSATLHGYDPLQFHRLGFTYRINRKNGLRQNFSANSDNFSIESQPSLWSSLNLITS